MNKPYIVRHGEVILKQVHALPNKVTLEKETKRHIVAHSETGHHHVLEAVEPFTVWAWNGETYLEIKDIAKLWHQKAGPDTHKPHKIIPGTFKVIIKKNFDYFKGKLERVRD